MTLEEAWLLCRMLDRAADTATARTERVALLAACSCPLGRRSTPVGTCQHHTKNCEARGER